MRQLLFSLLLLLPCTVSAQTATPDLSHDSLAARLATLEREHATLENEYAALESEHARLQRRARLWDAITPDHMRLQFCGNVGLVNLGVGWAYGKRDQWETDLMVGYVPKYTKDEALATLTLRQSFVPWTKGLYHGRTILHDRPVRFTLQPLSCGLMANAVLDGDYWVKEPVRYPDRDYYRFSTKVRFHIFVGQRYTMHFPNAERLFFKNASFVWEVSSCDLYLVSKIPNSWLSVTDILSLSLGLKMDF